MQEPFSRVLRMPFDEIVRCVFEGQEDEAEGAGGETIRALEALTAAMMGGSS